MDKMEKNEVTSSAGAGKVGQEQVHNLLFGEQLSWQAIIYDLINSEQLNPWDIDLAVLANKYLEKVRQLEEANFFVSSKVLLAAALLLRIKSEILLNREIPSLDEILFGKEEKKEYKQERIELDEEIPELVARTPLPRFRKVSLQELLAALGKAIKTENRRIQRVVRDRQHEIEAGIALPKNRINIRDEIKKVYSKLVEMFKGREHKIAFSEFASGGRSEKIASFVPLLHLDNQHKVWLEQEGTFEEIWIWLKEMYEKQHAEILEKMRQEVEQEIKEMSQEEKKRAEDIEKMGEPLKELMDDE